MGTVGHTVGVVTVVGSVCVVTVGQTVGLVSGGITLS